MKSHEHQKKKDTKMAGRLHRTVAPALMAVLLAAPLVASPAYADSGAVPASGSAATQGKGADEPVKKVTGGVVRGSVDEDGVQVFKGIPYAASTAGENRWRPPQPVKWTGVKDTTAYGPIAVQNPAFGAFGPWTPEYLDTDMTLENGLMSEDSLSLNVWTTAKQNAGKPVIVYIHGGGNQSGSGGNEVYTGQEIAQKDVVYVSVNYRVGIFGFLAYKDATGAEVTGNFAIQDQIASLQWVRDNIRAFGGDPANVTIAGQSAGSGNVQTLIASPAAAGLFDRAVAMSSNAINRSPSTLAAAQTRATQAFGQYTIAQLRAMTSTQVQALTATYNPTGPVIDGQIVTHSLADAYLGGTANPVDLMIGNVDGDGGILGALRLPDDNSDPFDQVGSVTPEVYAAAVTAQLGAQFLDLYPVDPAATNVIETARQLNADGMVSLAARQAEVREANYADENSYVYQFSHIVPDTAARMEAYGAFHTGDVGYWTNYFSGTWNRPWTEVDDNLGDLMSSYLVDFAADGTVEGWPAYDPSKSVVEYMHFDDVSAVDTLDEAKAAAWREYWTP
jgi:para-nitrobenzyl esterase